jgi:nucleoid DNA-binding protein
MPLTLSRPPHHSKAGDPLRAAFCKPAARKLVDEVKWQMMATVTTDEEIIIVGTPILSMTERYAKPRKNVKT